jgi:hypothetical protein
VQSIRNTSFGLGATGGSSDDGDGGVIELHGVERSLTEGLSWCGDD